MIRMGKKKSGERATPRQPVQVPTDWLRIAKAMAAKRPAPVVWYLIELVKRDAEAAGLTDLPPTPWDETPAE